MSAEDNGLVKLQQRMRQILAELRYVCGDAIAAFPGGGYLPMLVKKFLRRFFQTFDESCRLFLSHRQDSGTTPRPRCTVGCSFCCYQMPYGVSSLEYLYVYEGIWNMSPTRLYLPRLIDRNERFGVMLYDIQRRTKTIEEGLQEYAHQMIPCPFLDLSSGLCEIYSFRPIACRMHVSFDPPRYCCPTHQEFHRCNSINVEPSPMVKEALYGLDSIFRFRLSPFFVVGITGFMVNVMGCRPIVWKP